MQLGYCHAIINVATDYKVIPKNLFDSYQHEHEMKCTIRWRTARWHCDNMLAINFYFSAHYSNLWMLFWSKIFRWRRFLRFSSNFSSAVCCCESRALRSQLLSCSFLLLMYLNLRFIRLTTSLGSPGMVWNLSLRPPFLVATSASVL